MKKFICLLLVFILFFGGIPTNDLKANAASYVTISIDSLNVREGPGLSYRVVAQVKQGENFQIVKDENDWIQIKLPNRQYGWVANWLVQKQTQITDSSQSETKKSVRDGRWIKN